MSNIIVIVSAITSIVVRGHSIQSDVSNHWKEQPPLLACQYAL